MSDQHPNGGSTAPQPDGPAGASSAPQERAVVESPPVCCGEAMVHNSFTGMYECADAYFYLHDEGLLGDCGDLITWRRRLTKFDRERFEHWKASWVPDQSEAAPCLTSSK